MYIQPCLDIIENLSELLSRPCNELPAHCVRSLDSTKHNILRDQSLHVPDSLSRRTRQLGDPPNLLVGDLGDAELLECDGEVYGLHEREVLVQLGRGCADEDKLSNNAEGDLLAVQEVVYPMNGREAVMDL